MSKNRKGISINLGISGAFIILIIFTTVSLCAFIFIMLRGIMREELRKQMHNSVGIGSLMIDGDLHNTLKTSDQEDGSTYLKLKNTLKSIRDLALDINFVYTMRKNDAGEYIFVVDAEDDPLEMSHIGDVYDNPTPAMDECFDRKDTVIIEHDFATDEWGTWLSGFAPIYTGKGEFAGILGIDMSAKKIVDNEQSAFMVLFAVAAAVSIIVVILSIIVSRRITTPLRMLENDMAQITRFRIEEDMTIPSPFKEIQSMNLAINNMKGSLRSFRKYVPADLVGQLITLNKEARLGAEKKELTIFFSDIQGSTTFAEKLAPEKLIEAMADYFGGMTKIVMDNHGTVDKYIGDCIMAFWGAPLPLDDHAYHGCVTALACLKFQNEFNERQAKLGRLPLYTRIGIHTSEVLVGNIGYEDRLNYTLMGDAANLASRLEGVNKMYHTYCLISDSTYKKVQGRVLVRPLDQVVVKGKTESIRIYELLSLSENASTQMRDFSQATEEAFRHYQDREWEKALALYGKIAGARPDDQAINMLMDRCRKFQKEPPPESWTGAIVLREK
ncbi:MAG: adenylate/guanylate cyclase domain-containing protein [Spirochaetaceae bacterium]|nr:MAG: adenylate/guanylate cyclase domain-containing protein [Spirochaetaceae bacterium]